MVWLSMVAGSDQSFTSFLLRCRNGFTLWIDVLVLQLRYSAIALLTKNAKEFTRAASMLGVFVVGALTCNYANVSLGMMIP